MGGWGLRCCRCCPRVRRVARDIGTFVGGAAVGDGLGANEVCATGTLGGGVAVGAGMGSSGSHNNLPFGDMVTLGGGAAVGVGDGSVPANNVPDGDNGTLGGGTLGDG